MTLPRTIDLDAIAKKIAPPSVSEENPVASGDAATIYELPNFVPNEGQTKAIFKARDWYKAARKQAERRHREVSFGGSSDSANIFKLFGWAGTGKTSIVPFILEAIGVLPHQVVFMTYTGKAALVLSKKSKRPVGTIHSNIYVMREDPVTGEKKVQLKQDSPVAYARLIVLDEVSMVNKKIMEDLLSFGVPILTLGDPFQIPPVGGDAYFGDETVPDVMLTEITRQALDNPIVWMSRMLREGGYFTKGFHGDPNGGFVWCGDYRDIDTSAYLMADQVICGYNKTRCDWNRWFRKEVGIMADDRDIYPHRGDKLICLKNNHSLGVVNGMILQALDTAAPDPGSNLFFNLSVAEHGVQYPPQYLDTLAGLRSLGRNPNYEELGHAGAVLMQAIQDSKRAKEQGLNPTPDYSLLADNKALINHSCYTGWLFEPVIPDHLKVHPMKLKDVLEVDYGYVISGHKSQGSQWDSIVMLNEPPLRENLLNRRWQYTVLTRAERRAVVVGGVL